MERNRPRQNLLSVRAGHQAGEATGVMGVELTRV